MNSSTRFWKVWVFQYFWFLTLWFFCCNSPNNWHLVEKNLWALPGVKVGSWLNTQKRYMFLRSLSSLSICWKFLKISHHAQPATVFSKMCWLGVCDFPLLNFHPYQRKFAIRSCQSTYLVLLNGSIEFFDCLIFWSQRSKLCLIQVGWKKS